MKQNPESKKEVKEILDSLLTNYVRQDIALMLQEVHHIPTVGAFLRAWKNPENQKKLAKTFDTPGQARNAVKTFVSWMGIPTPPEKENPDSWNWFTPDIQVPQQTEADSPNAKASTN